MENNPFNKLARPAQRALANAEIKTLEQLTELSEAELMQLHGMGKNTLKTIKDMMAGHKLSFTQKEKQR